MKICIISDFFVPHYHGGGERRYFEVAKRLVDRGYNVDVVCMKIQGAEDHEIIERINVYHLGPKIKKPPYRTAFNFIHFIISTFLWILKHDYDVIDAQTYVPLVPAFFGGNLKRIPVIGTIHDVSSKKGDQWFIYPKIAYFFEKILLRLSYDKIITVSNQTKNTLVKDYNAASERIYVIPPGVDLDFIDSVKIDKKYKNSIIFVGRLAPHKHVDDLIKAVDLLKKDLTEIKLRIIGDGVEKDKLVEIVDNLKLHDHVKFLGDLEYREVISEIKKSNVLALPSTREGFGMVLAEANACYVPVVAYKSGGVVEVIDHGKNGFLVEPRDINGLTKKIKFLLENDDVAMKMSRYGREKAEKLFDWDKVVGEIEEVYKK